MCVLFDVKHDKAGIAIEWTTRTELTVTYIRLEAVETMEEAHDVPIKYIEIPF